MSEKQKSGSALTVIGSTSPFLIDVTLVDTTTGERRVYSDGFDWNQSRETNEEVDGAIRYMYEDGNYSCDCNRGQFFAEAGGGEDPDLPCGDDRIIVESVVERSTGRVIYSEKVS